MLSLQTLMFFVSRRELEVVVVLTSVLAHLDIPFGALMLASGLSDVRCATEERTNMEEESWPETGSQQEMLSRVVTVSVATRKQRIGQSTDARLLCFSWVLFLGQIQWQQVQRVGRANMRFLECPSYSPVSPVGSKLLHGSRSFPSRCPLQNKWDQLGLQAIS